MADHESSECSGAKSAAWPTHTVASPDDINDELRHLLVIVSA